MKYDELTKAARKSVYSLRRQIESTKKLLASQESRLAELEKAAELIGGIEKSKPIEGEQKK